MDVRLGLLASLTLAGCDLDLKNKKSVELVELTRTETLAIRSLCKEAEEIASDRDWEHWEGLKDCTHSLERGAQMFKQGCGPAGVSEMIGTIESCMRRTDYDESEVDRCVERDVSMLQAQCGG